MTSADGKELIFAGGGGVNATVVFPEVASAMIAPAPTPAVVPFRWLSRSRRILLALAAVWVLNIFDLCFTMREARESHFVELNPIAAHLLGQPEHWLITYKCALLLAGSSILLLLRRYSVTELASWFLMAVSVYVGARWYVYFECLVDDRYSSFITTAMGS